MATHSPGLSSLPWGHCYPLRSSQTAPPGDTALRFGPLSLRLERDYEKYPLNRALRQILYELLYVQIPKKHKWK